jgi:deoxycytidylate deaminase
MSLDQDYDRLLLAYAAALWSVDPSTQNGAVVVSSDGEILGQGYNHIPVGWYTEHTWFTDQKYTAVIHAEIAAIVDAVRAHGYPALKDATLYSPWYACEECAKLILKTQIARIVGHGPVRAFIAKRNPKWEPRIKKAIRRLQTAGIQCDWLHKPIDTTPIRAAGRIFNPTWTRFMYK